MYPDNEPVFYVIFNYWSTWSHSLLLVGFLFYWWSFLSKQLFRFYAFCRCL